MTSGFFRKLTASIFALLFGIHSSALADAKDKLTQLVSFYAANGHFNGTVLVARKGGNILVKGYGYADAAKRIPNDEKTVFQIGQVSMQFTAELMLLLDSQGKLGLEKKVGKYFPDLPGADKLTIKNLVTHTSGLYDYTSDSTIMGDLTKSISLDSLVTIIKSKPLAFEPGTKYQYSNTNYLMLGAVIERLTRWPLEDQLRTKVLQPSGMFHSGFDYANMRSEHKSIGYYDDGKELSRPAPVTDSSLTYGAANMYSTVDDLYKWHKALSAYNLIPQDWQDVGFVPLKYNYASGWEIQPMLQKKFLAQGGSVSGYSSYIVRQVSDDVVIVLLQNKMTPVAENKIIAHNIVKCLYDAAYKVPTKDNMAAEVEADTRSVEKAIATQNEKDSTNAALKLLEPPVVIEPKKIIEEKIEPYVPLIGEYITDPTFSVVITHIGSTLYAQPTSQDMYMLQADANNSLLYKATSEKSVEFVKDETGAIVKLIWRYSGKEKEALKNVKR